jgi:hypothetical protein
MGTPLRHAGQKPSDQTIHERLMVAPNIISQSWSSEKASQGRAASTISRRISRTCGLRSAALRACCANRSGKKKAPPGSAAAQVAAVARHPSQTHAHPFMATLPAGQGPVSRRIFRRLRTAQ